MVQLSEKGKQVTEFTGQTVADCQFITRHKAWAGNLQAAKNTAKNYSGDLGANYIFFEPPQILQDRAIVYASSYSCKSERMSLKRQCDLGNKISCEKWFQLSTTVPGAEQESAYAAKNGCEKGSEKLCNVLNNYKNLVKTKTLECEEGKGESCGAVGYFLYTMQDNQALSWYKKGCDLGSKQSCEGYHNLKGHIEKLEENKRDLASTQKEERDGDIEQYYRDQAISENRRQQLSNSLMQFSNYLNQQNQPVQNQNRNVNCQSRAQYDIYGKFLGYRTNCN